MAGELDPRPKYLEEENLEILNHNRVRLVEKVDTLVYVLRQRSKTVKDVTMALYEFMVREELQLKLQRQSEAFQEAGELALAKEYSQVYRILIELFDKFVELLGDEKVTMDEYLKLLDAGLKKQESESFHLELIRLLLETCNVQD